MRELAFHLDLPLMQVSLSASVLVCHSCRSFYSVFTNRERRRFPITTYSVPSRHRCYCKPYQTSTLVIPLAARLFLRSCCCQHATWNHWALVQSDAIKGWTWIIPECRSVRDVNYYLDPFFGSATGSTDLVKRYFEVGWHCLGYRLSIIT